MPIELPRKARGQRPQYFADPAIDRVMAITLSLAGEVSVMRDRMDTIERLCAEGKPFGPSDIDAYEPSSEVQAEREQRRAQYLEQVLLVIQQDVDDLERRSESTYDEAVQSVETT